MLLPIGGVQRVLSLPSVSGWCSLPGLCWVSTTSCCSAIPSHVSSLWMQHNLATLAVSLAAYHQAFAMLQARPLSACMYHSMNHGLWI